MPFPVLLSLLPVPVDFDPDFEEPDVVFDPEVVALSVPELVFVADEESVDELESVADAVAVDLGAVVAVADAVSWECQYPNTGGNVGEILTSSRRT